MYVKDAKIVWNNLKGLICVYKPVNVKCSQIRKKIINTICTGLSELKTREPVRKVFVEENDSKYEVIIADSLSDHELVVGPRYQFKDVNCSWSSYLGTNTSGVLLLGINDGTRTAQIIRENKLAKSYKIKGVLGQATDDYFETGKVVERSTYKFIKLRNMERLMISIQAAHQKKMFELCGVDAQSQAAFEIAKKGLIRPASSKIPILYNIKCVEFESPHFTIEVQCINEYEHYLKTLIHDIGIQLHSAAYCTGIQCIRHGRFTLENALLSKHWNLQNILTNMEETERLLQQHQEILNQRSVILQ